MKPGEVTRLLAEWRSGAPQAFEELVPLVYDQLHRIAIGAMRRERLDHTLQATALVNELYVRLLNQRSIGWNDREHFFTFAARVMRNILIDHARANKAARRGGAGRKLPIADDLAWVDTTDEGLLDLEVKLAQLEQMDSRKARLVELRFFLALTNDEAAEVLGISRATVERDVKFVRAWLYRELKGRGAPA
ncbi:MAG: sigma-70 family RNA polymerase sigma factor [Bryobacteraceae bacterium]